MKPHVMYALSRELQTYIKSLKTVDLASLVEINRRLLKIQQEVAETFEKLR